MILAGCRKTLAGFFTVGEAEGAKSSFATLAFLVVFRVLIRLFFSMDITPPRIPFENFDFRRRPSKMQE
jgi:hypothetical protein